MTLPNGLPDENQVLLNAMQYAVEEGYDVTLFGKEYIPAFTEHEQALLVEALLIAQEKLDDYADQFSDTDARLDEGVTRKDAGIMRKLAKRFETETTSDKSRNHE